MLTVETALGLGAVVGASSAAIVQVAWRGWVRRFRGWKALPWFYTDAQLSAPRGYDSKFVVAALRAAESALVLHTTWGATPIARIVGHIRVRVMPHEDCEEAREAKVRDYAGFRITVGSTLWGVCHEMAHLCELHLDKEVDMGHVGWASRGIWAAIAQYEQALVREMNSWKT